jgi:hypothetical protein
VGGGRGRNEDETNLSLRKSQHKRPFHTSYRVLLGTVQSTIYHPEPFKNNPLLNPPTAVEEWGAGFNGEEWRKKRFYSSAEELSSN